ncbi:MAG: AraC family transcriptional regulator [Hamadaea sp.]|uniref:helix-turn-helix domain-containing protein n=1 Tax=Hamadaea sp. TaxID=2024425 RepID=UPI0017A13C97|nr:helix-turn-helix domain-containing protein [Hamadaea sp.]NUR73390.1 AraC family transcriptional regulator [Hamadaea sp.]NUT18537.1 AraC family transcriptional regulator [Hamadaea sp.]
MPVAETADRLAPAYLRHAVGMYRGYHYSGQQPGVHRGLPSLGVTVVISLDAPTLVALDAGEPALGYASLASGMTVGPAYIPHDGSQYGVQLELTPAGARDLLGLPAAPLAAAVVPLPDLLGPDARELIDRLAAAPDWPRRFDVLDEILTRRLDRAPRRDPAAEVAQAWDILVAQQGVVRVEQLAKAVGWSRRHLSARFAAEFGVSPKDAARIARFDRSHRLLRADRKLSLADISARCGYYDQPHLDREWRALAGAAPTTWLAEENLPLRPLD